MSHRPDHSDHRQGYGPSGLVRKNQNIVNMSLISRIFPSSMKAALIHPLLKKLSLNPDMLKNFRPVSNLSFLSKIIERIAADLLFKHMSDNNLHDLMQSAYKAVHSMEMALLHVQNDILTALDNKSGVYLTLINLSVAFGTVDHSILLEFMKDTLDIEDTAWDWFASYIAGHRQKVSIENTGSELAELLYGVPQGSVMWLIKYCIHNTNWSNNQVPWTKLLHLCRWYAGVSLIQS